MIALPFAEDQLCGIAQTMWVMLSEEEKYNRNLIRQIREMADPLESVPAEVKLETIYELCRGLERHAEEVDRQSDVRQLEYFSDPSFHAQGLVCRDGDRS